VFCVALARSVDPSEMLNVARARRLADSIEQVMAGSTVRRIIDVHERKVTMVFADIRRESGWTAPAAPSLNGSANLSRLWVTRRSLA